MNANRETRVTTLSCHTTRGPFEVSLRPELCPNASAHLARLVGAGYYSQGLGFYRINKGIVQFGADETPAARRKRGAEDPFREIRHGSMRDRHPKCDPFMYPSCDKLVLANYPWQRGTFAMISPTQIVVTRRAGRRIGTNVRLAIRSAANPS